MGVISEPYRIPEEHSCWAKDTSKVVAITWRNIPYSSPCTQTESKRGMVAVDWGQFTIIGVYASPLAEYEERLEDIADVIKRRPNRLMIVAGDFNAKSVIWGSPRTDARGRLTERWAAQNRLTLANVETTSTRVGRWGESVIDLTWTTPTASRRLHNWRVATELESLSDHRIICMEMEHTPPTRMKEIREQQKNRPRWAIKKLDEDLLRAAVTTVKWMKDWKGAQDIAGKVDWLQKAMRSICDVAMPRMRQHSKIPAYWWSDNIAQLRRKAISANRELMRARRFQNPDRMDLAWENRKKARKELATASVAFLRKAKVQAWEEALQELGNDPWGRPYKIVMKRLRPRTPPITQVLEPQFLAKVLSTLFPAEESEEEPFQDRGRSIWREEYRVTPSEIMAAIRRMNNRKVPGPDGIPLRNQANRRGTG